MLNRSNSGSGDSALISNCRLPGHVELVDIGISDGRVSSIKPSQAPGSEAAVGLCDADGGLVLPAFAEAHIHLEKAYLLNRLPRDAATLSEAIALTAELKQGFTQQDMRSRALRVIRKGVRHGVTAMRAHVELDDTLSLTAMDTMLQLKEDLRDLVTLQVTAFPQDGIFQQKSGQSLMREALRSGADVVGGIPYNDRSTDEHLDFVFGLASEFGKPLDFHVDLSDDPAQRDILKVIVRTLESSMQGRVTAGHLTSLGSIPAAEARDICAALAEARISVVALPATDVYLNGRGDEERPRRGLTPVRMLAEAGVNVATATNNIQNPFTPFGRGNILDTAFLLAELCHLGTARDAEFVLQSITDNAARAMQLQDYGVKVGRPADLSIFAAVSAREVLNDCYQPTHVVKNGRMISEEDIPG